MKGDHQTVGPRNFSVKSQRINTLVLWDAIVSVTVFSVLSVFFLITLEKSKKVFFFFFLVVGYTRMAHVPPLGAIVSILFAVA